MVDQGSGGIEVGVQFSHIEGRTETSKNWVITSMKSGGHIGLNWDFHH